MQKLTYKKYGMKMNNNEKNKEKTKMKHLFLIAIFALLANSFADTNADIREAKLQKETLESEIKKLSGQISETDSLIRSDAKRKTTLEARYKADLERRRSEMDSLNAKIQTVALDLQAERGRQMRAKNRSENVKAKRNAFSSVLLQMAKELEAQIAQTVPWELEMRLDRVKSLARDIESKNANEEELFSRMKSILSEEIKFGDEVVIVNSPLTRKNGEVINARILRIGNQWMVYSDENSTVYGRLTRKIENGKIAYEWDEELDLTERAAIQLALDVKEARKPPQIVKLPLSLSIVTEGK